MIPACGYASAPLCVLGVLGVSIFCFRLRFGFGFAWTAHMSDLAWSTQGPPDRPLKPVLQGWNFGAPVASKGAWPLSRPG